MDCSPCKGCIKCLTATKASGKYTKFVKFTHLVKWIIFSDFTKTQVVDISHFSALFLFAKEIFFKKLIFFWWIKEAVAHTCSVKKLLLEISQKFVEKHLCQSIFFNKVADAACNFIKKETLAQVFSCQFCEISKNSFFYRTPLMAASGITLKILEKPKGNTFVGIHSFQLQELAIQF